MPGPYIPNQDAEFDEWFRNFEANVGPIATALGIPIAFVTAVTSAYADWQVKYPAHQTAQNAARTAAENKDESRDAGKDAIRALAGMLQNHPDMTDGQRATLKLTVPDTEPTPRPAISTIPIVGFKTLRGGDIEVAVRVEEDQTRPSMHPAADAVEVRYAMMPVGELPPEKPAQCPGTHSSKKAQFKISAGIENAGKRLYGFFRWVNISNPQNNGPWSDPQSVVIA